MDPRHPGIAKLLPHQQRFFDEFQALRPQRAILAWPVGVGRTFVAATLADLLSREGLVLIVTPAGTVPHWADQVRELQRSNPSGHERTVTVVDRESNSYLQGLRNVAAQASPFALSHDVIVISVERAVRQGMAELLPMIPWRIVVVDEAHRLVESARGTKLAEALTEDAQSILAIAPRSERMLPFPGARLFEWDENAATSLKRPVRHHPIWALPTATERDFIESLQRWVIASPTRDRKMALRLAVLNPMAAISFLERLAVHRDEAAEYHLDEVDSVISLQPTRETSESVGRLLELGDLLEPPGSKTLRTIDVIAESTPSDQPALVVATLMQDVTAVEQGVRLAGRIVESVSAKMEPDERLAAAERIRRRHGVLVASDASLSGPLATGFDFVIHRDSGLGGAGLDRRLARLPNVDHRRRPVNNLVVVWPEQFETEPQNTEPETIEGLPH